MLPILAHDLLSIKTFIYTLGLPASFIQYSMNTLYVYIHAFVCKSYKIFFLYFNIHQQLNYCNIYDNDFNIFKISISNSL